MADIELKPIKHELLVVTVAGTAPLIVHAWSQKAKQMMLAKQQGRKVPKEVKVPQDDYEASMYRFDDGGHGFPVTGFKQATVKGGARAFGKAVKMTELRQVMTFMEDGIDKNGMPLARLSTADPTMREDMVRLSGVTADIRYRAEYPAGWTVDLNVMYVPSIISADSIVALIDAGGRNGVGEWRPEKNGTFGTYRVEQ